MRIYEIDYSVSKPNKLICSIVNLDGENFKNIIFVMLNNLNFVLILCRQLGNIFISACNSVRCIR